MSNIKIVKKVIILGSFYYSDEPEAEVYPVIDIDLVVTKENVSIEYWFREKVDGSTGYNASKLSMNTFNSLDVLEFLKQAGHYRVDLPNLRELINYGFYLKGLFCLIEDSQFVPKIKVGEL